MRVADILNLPGWTALSIQEEGRLYRVLAEVSEHPHCCPWCETLSAPYHFGKREFTFTDLPMHGKQVCVVARRQRFRCRACQRTWLSPLPGIDEHHAVTERLIQYVERETLSLSSRTFVSLAHELGLAESSIRNLFDACVKKREQRRTLQTPRILGIDEVHLLGAPRCILTDIAEKKVIDLLENRRLETVMAWLKQLPSKNLIEAVAMDMWAQYRTCVREMLPGTKIVIDAFHVLKLASACLETVRKTVRSQLFETQVRRLMHDRYLLLRRPGDLSEQDRLILEAWLGSFPVLREAYERKEEFYAIYEATSQQEALDHYFSWFSKVTPDLFSAFLPLMTAVENWGDEIFNYWRFDEAITNAFTEAKNGALKVVNRVGRGYGLSVIRAKVLFAEEIGEDYGVKLPRLAEVVSTL